MLEKWQRTQGQTLYAELITCKAGNSGKHADATEERMTRQTAEPVHSISSKGTKRMIATRAQTGHPRHRSRITHSMTRSIKKGQSCFCPSRPCSSRGPNLARPSRSQSVSSRSIRRSTRGGLVPGTKSRLHFARGERSRQDKEQQRSGPGVFGIEYTSWKNGKRSIWRPDQTFPKDDAAELVSIVITLCRSDLALPIVFIASVHSCPRHEKECISVA